LVAAVAITMAAVGAVRAATASEPAGPVPDPGLDRGLPRQTRPSRRGGGSWPARTHFSERWWGGCRPTRRPAGTPMSGSAA